jgi:hypothetical protein
MEKTYSILIQYGDGKPVASKIRARDGVDAQDKALASHPGARSIRITGVLAVHLPKPVQLPKPKPKAHQHQLFTDVDEGEIGSYIRSSPQETKLQICHQLRREGLTYRAIAKQLDVGETTVRTWIKNTMPS